MASGNVVLRFVTGYVGKGVDMLKAAMSSTGRIVARSIGAMTDAFGKLGSLGGSQINKFVQELGNLGKLVAQGGVWGAAQFAVVKLFETIKERLDAGKRHLERFAEAFKGSMSSAVNAVEAKFKRFTDGLARAVAMSKAILGYRKAGDSADTSAAIAGVNAREREALATAANDSARAVISANAALERAKINAAESTRAATAELAEADSSVVQAQKRIAAAEDAVSAARRNYNKATRHRIAVLQSKDKTDKSEKAADEAYANAKGALAKAEAELAKARDDAKLAEVAHMTEKEKARKVEADAAEQVAAAEFALAEADRSAAKRSEEEVEKAKASSKKAELMAAIEERGREMLATARTESERAVVKANVALAKARLDAEAMEGERSAKAAAAASAVAAAESALAEAKRKAAEEAERAEQGRIWAEQGKARLEVKKAGLSDLDKTIGELDIQIKKIGENASLVNGAMSRFGRSTGRGGFLFADWQRARVRQESAETADERADASARKRYERLAKRRARGVHLSRRDARFVSDWEAYADAKNGSADIERRKAELEKQRDGLRKEAVDLLKEINENLMAAITVE